MRRVLVVMLLVAASIGVVGSDAGAQEGVCVEAMAGRIFLADGFQHVVLPGTRGALVERQGATVAYFSVLWSETYRYANSEPVGPAVEANAAYSQIKRVPCGFFPE